MYIYVYKQLMEFILYHACVQPHSLSRSQETKLAARRKFNKVDRKQRRQIRQDKDEDKEDQENQEDQEHKGDRNAIGIV